MQICRIFNSYYIIYFLVFIDMWQALVTDVTAVTKEIIDVCKGKDLKHVYMSLPRPGVSNLKYSNKIFFLNK